MREAIDSALAQTYTNIEIIVINDGSTDGDKTDKVAKSYGDKIRYFKKENGGVATALNLGIEEMKGEYFSWLSHDDFYSNNKVEKEVEILQHQSANTIVVSDYSFVDAHSQIIRKVRLPQNIERTLPLVLAYNGIVHGCTFLIPASCFHRHGTFNESLKTVQDYDMWFRLSLHCRVVVVREVLVFARMHSEQDSVKHREVLLHEGFAYYKKALLYISNDDVLLQKQQKSAWFVEAANVFMRQQSRFLRNIALSLAWKHFSLLTSKNKLGIIKFLMKIFVLYPIRKLLRW